ncbi:Uncharacterised protein [Vibrio cholerae]|nr:Uncharacterised protein [Vibrio cholerae]CSD31182.1 Uncharacterised protein [Vibrio cholerae]
MRLLKRGFQSGRAIWHDAEINRFAAEVFNQGFNAVAVAVVNLSGLQWFTEWFEFVAGGEKRDFRFAIDGDMANAESRNHRDITCG